MGSRDFHPETPRHRHNSNRRPHGAGGRRTDDFDDGGMDDFVNSFDGMSMGSHGHDILDNRYVSPSPAEHKHGEHRHGGQVHREHGHKERRHGEEHRHKEHKHKEHRDEERRHKDHGHKQPVHGDHRREGHGHKKHEHKHEHEGNHHGETKHADHRQKKGSSSGGRHATMTMKEFCRMLYTSALLPFREGSGIPYPCKQSEIDFHRNGVFHKPNKGPFVSLMQATNEVMRWNDEKRAPPREELETILNLVTAVREAEKNLRFGPDLLIKTFADLDRVFFAGRLRGHVLVRWVKRIEKDGGLMGIARHRKPRPGKCVIEMSAEKNLLPRTGERFDNERDPVLNMFSTVLHEMCHAYAFIRCPPEAWKTVDQHCSHFQTRISVVHDRATRLLGMAAIGYWEGCRQRHFLPSEGEKGQKEGSAKQGGGRKRWGDQKGTDCVIM